MVFGRDTGVGDLLTVSPIYFDHRGFAGYWTLLRREKTQIPISFTWWCFSTFLFHLLPAHPDPGLQPYPSDFSRPFWSYTCSNIVLLFGFRLLFPLFICVSWVLHSFLVMNRMSYEPGRKWACWSSWLHCTGMPDLSSVIFVWLNSLLLIGSRSS